METDQVGNTEEDGISSYFDEVWKNTSKELLKSDLNFTKVTHSSEEI